MKDEVFMKLKVSRSLPIILSGPKGYKCPSFSLKHDGSHHLEVLAKVGEQWLAEKKESQSYAIQWSATFLKKGK